MRVAIVNYGMGNLGSVRRALQDLGADAFVAEHPTSLFDANRIVLPGVGSFAVGMSRLRAGGWEAPLRELTLEHEKPLLGICLGMQMLADSGDEGGSTAGLALLPGRVRRLDMLGCSLRVPHVGWNEITFSPGCQLLEHIPAGSDFYFVHSYSLETRDDRTVMATTDYDIPLVAVVQRGHVFGTQFHPEKSSKAGRQLLRNFLDYVPC